MGNRPRRSTIAVYAALALWGCSESEAPPADQGATPMQAVSFLGDTLYAVPSPGAVEVQNPLLAEARDRLEADPSDPDAWIWVGRRLGYLQEYQEAIRTYTDALSRFPDEPRLLRHRGHRYISVRDIPAAIADLARAGELVRGTEDEVEPDGLPNARGIPTSTLHFNIWYHLALAHFIQGDYEAALSAYRDCMTVSTNPDALVATSYWMYMTLRRLGRDDEAQELLLPVTAELDIIENDSYRDLLLLFKGEVMPEDVVPSGDEDALASATTLYGVANWHLFEGRVEDGNAVLDRLLAMDGQWASFGYIAAEADVARR